MSIFTGNATAMITPFNQKGIDFDAFDRHLEFQIENGTSALVIAGTTGEPATMTADEKKSLLKFAVRQVRGRVPVRFGTGCNDTAETINNSVRAQDLGADALLLVTPKGLVKHFEAVSDAINIPAITYNVPSRTGLNIKADTLKEIAQLKNIAAHKESGGSIYQVMDMVRKCSDIIDIYSGDDLLTFPLLACGGIGSISVVSNICPKESADLVASYMSGDIAMARKTHYNLIPLINKLFIQVNPIPVKSAMNMMGMNAGKVRLPLVELDDEDKEQLHQILDVMELL